VISSGCCQIVVQIARMRAAVPVPGRVCCSARSRSRTSSESWACAAELVMEEAYPNQRQAQPAQKGAYQNQQSRPVSKMEAAPIPISAAEFNSNSKFATSVWSSDFLRLPE